MLTSPTDDAVHRRVLAQFSEMLRWRAWGWCPAPAGHRCRECGGPQWFKVEGRGRVERYRCVHCGAGRDVMVK